MPGTGRGSLGSSPGALRPAFSGRQDPIRLAPFGAIKPFFLRIDGARRAGDKPGK